MQISGGKSGVLVAVDARYDNLVAIGQQLCWLAATCRIPSNGVCRSSSCSVLSMGGYVRIALDPLMERCSPTSVSSCWLPLFENMSMACDYPIPPRAVDSSDDMLRGPKNVTPIHYGLEIPYSLMTALAGIRYPLIFDGGTILKSSSIILIPIKASKEGIQWHLHKAENGSTFSIEDVARLIHETPCWYKTTEIENFASKKHFLGYCCLAEIHLGTKNSGSEYVQRSRALEEDSCLHIKNFSASLGTEGLGYFGGAIGATMKLSKGLKASFDDRHLTDDDRLRRSSLSPLIFYDTGSGRGYMVPELSAILHCLHSWSAVQRISASVPFADVSSDGGDSAMTAIMQGKDNILHESLDGTPVRVIDKVTLFLDRFDQLKEQGLLRSQEMSLKRIVRKSDKLLGWELEDLVNLKNPMSRKAWSLTKHSPWLQYVLKNQDILVLFSENFQPPIRSSRHANLCNSCVEIPQNNSLLVASNHCAIKLGLIISSDRNSLGARCDSSHPYEACEVHKKGLRYRIQTCFESSGLNVLSMYNLRRHIDGATILGSVSSIASDFCRCIRTPLNHTPNSCNTATTELSKQPPGSIPINFSDTSWISSIISPDGFKRKKRSLENSQAFPISPAQENSRSI